MKIKKALAALSVAITVIVPTLISMPASAKPTTGQSRITAHTNPGNTHPQANRPQDPADPTDDPNLNQTVSSDEKNATGKHELSKGHIDMGPRMVNGKWTLMVRDDSVAPPVWRKPDEVVLRVKDSALLQIPDDPNYAFLNLSSGKKVYVIPQTQNMDVIWLGWSTQDPAVTKMIDRGAKLVLEKVSGPGQFNLFLQSGSFDPPQELFNSTKKMPQEIWANVNTHVHANWVFTEPGVYLVTISAVAKNIDGGDLKDTTTLRFAVGDKTKTEDALATNTNSQTPANDSTAVSKPTAEPNNSSSPAPAKHSTSSTFWIVCAIVALAVLIGAASLIGVFNSRKAKREAEQLVAENSNLTSADPERQ